MCLIYAALQTLLVGLTSGALSAAVHCTSTKKRRSPGPCPTQEQTKAGMQLVHKPRREMLPCTRRSSVAFWQMAITNSMMCGEELSYVSRSQLAPALALTAFPFGSYAGWLETLREPASITLHQLCIMHLVKNLCARCCTEQFAQVSHSHRVLCLLQQGWPFPVFCCWNGLVVLNSQPFRQAMGGAAAREIRSLLSEFDALAARGPANLNRGHFFVAGPVSFNSVHVFHRTSATRV